MALYETEVGHPWSRVQAVGLLAAEFNRDKVSPRHRKSNTCIMTRSPQKQRGPLFNKDKAYVIIDTFGKVDCEK
jgi:hypothetical protein